jgi:predicted NUDIX family NTP pyrophosphohydrolase
LSKKLLQAISMYHPANISLIDAADTKKNIFYLDFPKKSGSEIADLI